MYAKIIDGEIQTIRSLKAQYPNTSFSSPQPSEHDGWKKVIDNGGTVEQKRGDITEQDGVFTQTYVIDRDAIAAHLPKYGKAFEDSALAVQGFTEDGTEEHRRNAKEALDFIEELGENAPASIPWASPNHGAQTVTPAVLKAWLIEAGMRRLKRFEIQAALDPSDYDTIEDLEGAFDAAYEA